MSKYYHPDTDQFRKWDAPAPTTVPHLTEEEIRANLKPMLPNKWRLEGNQLIAETENGTHAQTIPTNYILVGTDENQMPIFRKISL